MLVKEWQEGGREDRELVFDTRCRFRNDLRFPPALFGGGLVQGW